MLSIIVLVLSCSHCLYLAACLTSSMQDVTSVGGGGECDCVCVGFWGVGGGVFRIRERMNEFWGHNSSPPLMNT